MALLPEPKETASRGLLGARSLFADCRQSDPVTLCREGFGWTARGPR